MKGRKEGKLGKLRGEEKQQKEVKKTKLRNKRKTFLARGKNLHLWNNKYTIITIKGKNIHLQCVKMQVAFITLWEYNLTNK